MSLEYDFMQHAPYRPCISSLFSFAICGIPVFKIRLLRVAYSMSQEIFLEQASSSAKSLTVSPFQKIEVAVYVYRAFLIGHDDALA